MYEKITSDNVMMFAIRHYENPQCEGEKEFHDDMKRFKYIKRLLRKYKDTDILKERLLLNHIIVFYNVFSVEAATRILFYKLEEEFWPMLKTFLFYLSFLPEKIESINGKEILTDNIPMDQGIVDSLRHFDRESNLNAISEHSN